MRSEGWLREMDGRLADQFRFLLEIDRLKTVIRAIGFQARRDGKIQLSTRGILLSLLRCCQSGHSVRSICVVWCRCC